MAEKFMIVVWDPLKLLFFLLFGPWMDIIDYGLTIFEQVKRGERGKLEQLTLMDYFDMKNRTVVSQRTVF